jgi:MFS transporter, DHA2 family, glioxin efflux transporter
LSILNAGATQLKEIVSSDSLDGVLKAYVAGFRETLVIAIAFAGAALISTLGFRFLSIRQTRIVEGQNS